uniref:F-box domain-containing protein n=1 Tax=Steinernema glaseri TaxID=37863 RepID=A0A1I7ZEG2_9BILA
MTQVSLTSLPSELQLRILQYLSAKELNRCSTASKILRAVISTHALYLERIPCSLRVIVCQKCRIELQANSVSSKFACDVDALDEQILSRVSIKQFHLAGNGSAIPAELFRVILDHLIHYRHRNIKSVTITDSFVEAASSEALLAFFNFTLHTANRLSVTNSIFPVDIPLSAIETSEDLLHFQCTNTFVHEAELPLGSSTAIVQRFTRTVRQMGDHRRTLQLDTSFAEPSTVAEFLKAWSETVDPPFFTMTFQRIGTDWQDQFLHECAVRGLNHCFYEFPSKRQPTAHIKVKFHPEMNKCEMWPVFDVPARTSGQQICYARYFRDF